MWTSSSEIKKQAVKIWESGKILSALVSGREIFPLKMTFKKPSSEEISGKFAEVREWIENLALMSKEQKGRGYIIKYATVNYRIVGTNSIPSHIYIESAEDAAYLTGRTKELRLFAALIEQTERECPQLLSYLERRPISVSAKGEEWQRLTMTALWLYNRQKPGIYIREIELPGIDTKFIENNKAILAEMFDTLLPASAIEQNENRTNGFAKRYGFKTAPLTVRFRPPLTKDKSDPSDITLTSDDFASSPIECKNIVVTENFTNFLSLPRTKDTAIIFGAGYGFENLAQAKWLSDKKIFYWGDIDTHGFAILSQFRKLFPKAVSIMMNEETLLSHISLCAEEQKPNRGAMTELTEAERNLCTALQTNQYGKNLRLEQERINFKTVREVMEKISVSQRDNPEEGSK